MGKEPETGTDEDFMRLALRLARRGKGTTKPNPMVGAVLVRDGRILGTGYHRKAGDPHAEVEAIRDARADLTGATLYVNLEPCSHRGRTPPCVDRILSERIGRVVVGTKDPNPLVNGRGIRILRRHGVTVTCGLLQAECRRLNEVFFKVVETGKPFVTLKAALSLDGKIAAFTGRSKWISCAASRRRVHRLRSLADAVLVGIGTVLKDDPRLTVRLVRSARNPCRVVMDSRLRTPSSARVLGPEARTVIATTDRARVRRIRDLEARGVVVEVFPADRSGRVPLGRLLQRLARRGVQDVLLEGGSGIYTAAIDGGEVDKLVLFLAPILLGGSGSPSLFGGRGFESPGRARTVTDLRWRRSDRDLLVEGYLGRS